MKIARKIILITMIVLGLSFSAVGTAFFMVYPCQYYTTSDVSTYEKAKAFSGTTEEVCNLLDSELNLECTLSKNLICENLVTKHSFITFKQTNKNTWELREDHNIEKILKNPNRYVAKADGSYVVYNYEHVILSMGGLLVSGISLVLLSNSPKKH